MLAKVTTPMEHEDSIENRKYDEYIYIDSHRLAPLGIYTAR